MSLINKIYNRFLYEKSPLIKKSKVFCMAPWIQLHAQTTGKVAPCCMSSVHYQNELGDLRENPKIFDSWNSENMKKLRKNMLKGEKSSICQHCYNYEAAGKFSERMTYNRDYKHKFHKISKTRKDGHLEDASVPLLDIRFNNKCNYKCRICDSAYSSLWYNEEIKIGKKPLLTTTKEMKVSYDDDVFWESYKDLLKGVERLHFAGGEPLVMEEHYKTLLYLIEIGRTDITLSYNTNFSRLKFKNYNIIELWNKFKKVDVWASLDGMGNKGDYQRKGQNWKKIEENIRISQKECKSLLFGINVTVSIFNIFDIPSFYKHMIENNFVEADRMNLYLLFDPSYYNITNLTPELKNKVNNLYKEFKSNYLNKTTKNKNILNHVDAVLNFMNSKQGNERDKFIHWVKEVDKVRSESFKETFPELKDFLSV